MDLPNSPAPDLAAVARRRTRGSRKLDILQCLAGMLEDPSGEKITTAALATRLQVSEAALYRHFASKAQMFEGLIDFIETTLFSLINNIADQEISGRTQTVLMLRVLLEFAQTNPGMTRVLVGDALLHENERLLERMNRFTDRVEASLRQALRSGVAQGEYTADFDIAARGNLMVAFVLGRWQRFVRSGFQRLPTEHMETQLFVLCQS
jgi:TetR/AcrR family transcriptional regulator